MSRVSRVPRLTEWMVRFLKFNGVGIVGFALQLALLALLLRLGVHYLAATAIAVELTVLHNFAWHERWTWRDRRAAAGGPSTWLGASRRRRLWRFQASNGLISLAGNLLLMRLLAGALDVPPLPATVVSVVACALVNFSCSDRFVFRVT
jgi:putative flippase GtrA